MDNVAIIGSADFTDEVLAENGLDHAVNRATLIHDSSTGNSILMPSEGLTPPPIDIVDQEAIEVTDELETLRANIAQVEDIRSRQVLEDVLNDLADSMLEEANNTVQADNTAVVATVDVSTNSSSRDSIDELVEGLISSERVDAGNTSSTPIYIDDRATTESYEDVFDEENDANDTEETDDSEETFIDNAINNDASELAMAEALEGATTEDTNSNLTTEELISMLPINPKSLLAVDETTSRFSGAAWYNAVQQSTVILAGLGGIGSYVLFLLSRMKPQQVFIYDDDIVEMANMSGQLYSKDMIGKKKVNAMAELADKFSEYHGVMAIDSRWDNTKSPSDIMICGFDNMEARFTFFKSWLHHLVGHKNPENCLFLDGRLSAEELQVFCIQGTDKYNIDRYNKEYLFADRQAEQTLCSFKQTSYCANMIGSIIVNLYTNFIANSLNPIIERDLPFKTYYDASMMYFKTEN